LLLAVAIALVVFAAGCGSGEDGQVGEPTATAEVTEPADGPDGATATAEPTEEPGVGITVKEWSLTADASSATAGEIVFVATNEGTMPHEVVFLRTDRPVDDLPLDDNQKVNRFAEGIEDLAVIRTDALMPGATVRESFDLPPGHYALICNIAGHYSSGMFTAFTIE
jgi:uncharacterized cupredoxin-like copper-binding protein